jgi:hypothetical protein
VISCGSSLGRGLPQLPNDAGFEFSALRVHDLVWLGQARYDENLCACRSMTCIVCLSDEITTPIEPS